MLSRQATWCSALAALGSTRFFSAMNSEIVYVAMRTTYRDPRHYGARLAVSTKRNEDDEVDMDSTCFDSLVWCQAADMVAGTFGKDAWKRLEPVNQSAAISQEITSATAPLQQCMYCLEGCAWFDRHPKVGSDLMVMFRTPGAHIEEDSWEIFDDIEEVRSIDYDECVWYVCQLNQDGQQGEAFLFVPACIAKKSLHRIVA